MPFPADCGLRLGAFIGGKPQLTRRKRFAGVLLERLFVDIDTETRRRRNWDITVRWLELVRRHFIAQLHERQEIFRNDEIRHKGRGLHGRGQSNHRRIIVMGRDHHISRTRRQPRNSWQISAPREYGFYANVNPEVDHPRWSQARERKIGGGLFAAKQPTLMFNGYADEVAHLYAGLDLRKNF